MKIEITIDCESIQDFQSHLLKLFEQTIIYCHIRREKDEDFDPGMDEFPYVDFEEIEKGFYEDNCYGSRQIKFIYSDIQTTNNDTTEGNS